MLVYMVERHLPGVEIDQLAAAQTAAIETSNQFTASGKHVRYLTEAVPSSVFGGVPTILFFTGKSTIFLKSGDQLLGTDTGSIDLPPGQGGFASLITFDGGTGDMSGATGQIRLRGEFDAAAATTSGDYIGKLCTP